MSEDGHMTGSLVGRGRLTRMIASAPQWAFVLYATAAGFCTYFCMYAFRKPFSAAKFEGEDFGWFSSELTLKSAIVISQIFGYAISKYIGIKVCSEVSPARRAWMMVGLIAVAELSLLVYGLVPGSWKVVPIFFNGLPLGMVWGLVVWYLEGRRTSEILLAGLSCSFIMSSGIVKDFGSRLMSGDIAAQWESVPVVGGFIGDAMGSVSEGWMPFVVGLHFLPLFLLSVWMLSRLPGPSPADELERTRRAQMYAGDRWKFVRQFAFGLGLLIAVYFVATAFRDYRDNFQVNILDNLKVTDDAAITKSETTVAFVVMGVMAALNAIRDNRKGLTAAFMVMGFGSLMMIVAPSLQSSGTATAYQFMVLTGLGSYLIYVPFNSMLFDRIIAFTRFSGTAVFAIYLADSIGYTGSVILLLIKDRIFADASHLQFFRLFTTSIGIFSLIFLSGALIYFLKKDHSKASAVPES